MNRIVQRIFYFHVPSALTSFLAFFTAFVASIAYLSTRRAFWDHLAHSAVELGVLFCTAVLVTGPLWARPVWGGGLVTAAVLGIAVMISEPPQPSQTFDYSMDPGAGTAAPEYRRNSEVMLAPAPADARHLRELGLKVNAPKA